MTHQFMLAWIGWTAAAVIWFLVLRQAGRVVGRFTRALGRVARGQ